MDLHDGGTFMDPWLLVLAYTVIAAGILYSRIYRVRREILAEYRARNQLLQTERLRVEVMEQQLELAKEIQDSLTPPQSIMTTFGARARFLQKKFHPLGGDWMAVRAMANGDTVFVVADVTGKGIGAALVVHALQSLWAQSLSSADFHVTDWLNAVNRTLLTLGKTKPHTSTIGVLVLSRKSLTYYSAGHVPCYLLIDRVETQVMLSRGNLVGFTDSLEITPVSFDLSETKSFTILLGTDGALPKGSRVRRTELLRLIDRVTQDPDTALNGGHVDDDQLLIAIEIPQKYGSRELRRAV
jgi:serine phosphatase RsbU (regulator of sigma subunit)